MADAFIIYSPENGKDMLPRMHDNLVCSECGMLVVSDYVNPEYRVARRRAEVADPHDGYVRLGRDIGHTYDGFEVCSERLKRFVESNGYDGIVFKPLPASPGFFVVNLSQVIPVTRPPQVKFEKKCKTCGRYQSVYGACYAALRVPGGHLGDGFYRSDIEFGYKLMMHPLWITTESVKNKIKEAKLTGFSFTSVEIVDV